MCLCTASMPRASNYIGGANERKKAAHMEREVDKWFEKHDANMSGFFEKEELRALVTSMAKEELGLDAGADAGAGPIKDKLIDRMINNYGEEGPAGVGITREKARTAIKRYRAWLIHEDMIDRLFKQADADKGNTLSASELKTFMGLVIKQPEFPELHQLKVTDADVGFIFERCDAQKDGVIDIEEAGPAVATWVQVARQKPKTTTAACAVL